MDRITFLKTIMGLGGLAVLGGCGKLAVEPNEVVEEPEPQQLKKDYPCPGCGMWPWACANCGGPASIEPIEFLDDPKEE